MLVDDCIVSTSGGGVVLHRIILTQRFGRDDEVLEELGARGRAVSRRKRGDVSIFIELDEEPPAITGAQAVTINQVIRN